MTYRNESYLAWVRQQPCIVCGSTPSDPHHRIGHGRLSNARVGDAECMPLCRVHHDELHRGWQSWEHKHGLQHRHILSTLLRAIEEGVFWQSETTPEAASARQKPATKFRTKAKIGGGRAPRVSPTARPNKINPRRVA